MEKSRTTESLMELHERSVLYIDSVLSSRLNKKILCIEMKYSSLGNAQNAFPF